MTPRSTNPNAVGRRLRRAREDRGWSQSELARRADVRPSSLSRVESGQTVAPSGDFLASIAAALGTSVDTILYGDDPSSRNSSEFRQYVAAMVGEDHADLIEAIVHAAAEKPSRDRDVILRVARNLIETFPSISTSIGK